MTSLTPNAQRLLRVLVVDGPTHRADLARALDVTRATVTNLTNALQQDGWIEEIRHAPGALKNPIGTAPRLGALASVVFLVDTCTVAVSRLDGRLLSECTLADLPLTDPESRLAAAAELLERLLEEQGLDASALRALHLAVDTQMDSRSGEIYSPQASRRWYGVNPREYFVGRFAAPIHLQNTARLEGLAESTWGAGRGVDNVLYVEVSHGVTSSHVTGGLIQSGSRGGSGELGHVVYDWSGPLCSCGNSGCVMQYVSIPALLRDYSTAASDVVDWPGFCTLVAQGDETASTIASRSAVVLGRALINTCHLIDPEMVVLSGEVVHALPAFADDVAETLRAGVLPLVGRSLRVVAAELADVHTATAHAGIESLRGLDDVVETATSPRHEHLDHAATMA